MRHFVISLKHAQQRRAHMQQQFEARDVAFAFFDAITPNELADTAKALGIKLYEPSALSPVEMACLLSHVSLWKQIAEGTEPLGAIYEDDVYLSLDFKNTIAAIEQHYQQSALAGKVAFDALKLESTFHPTITSPPQTWFGDFSLARLRKVHFGTAAYMLSRSCAKALWQDAIQRAQRHQSIPSDVLVFKEMIWKIKAMQLIPALAYQDSVTPKVELHSQLQQQRYQHEKQLKKQRGARQWLEKTWEKRHRHTLSSLLDYHFGQSQQHAFIPVHGRADLCHNNGLALHIAHSHPPTKGDI